MVNLPITEYYVLTQIFTSNLIGVYALRDFIVRKHLTLVKYP